MNFSFNLKANTIQLNNNSINFHYCLWKRVYKVCIANECTYITSFKNKQQEVLPKNIRALITSPNNNN